MDAQAAAIPTPRAVGFETVGGVVTGAGSGIGKAVTLWLAAAGATVVAVDIDVEAASRTARESTEAGFAGRVVPHRADVTDGPQVAGYVERTKEILAERPFTFFHNNAGVEGVHKSIVDTSEAEWDSVMAVNLRSAFLGLKYVIPALREGGGGAIVNTASVLSLKAAPDRSDYVVSKHAILGLTKTAAAECAAEGIKVNAVAPGPIETPLMTRSEDLVNPDDPGFERRRFEQGVPAGRYGRPEEVAELVAFLLGPDPAYLTGSLVSIDGGLISV